MIRFLTGFMLGAIIGTALMAEAAVVAGSGYIMGWDVTKLGETICSDPYVWEATHEIECD